MSFFQKKALGGVWVYIDHVVYKFCRYLEKMRDALEAVVTDLTNVKARTTIFLHSDYKDLEIGAIYQDPNGFLKRKS